MVHQLTLQHSLFYCEEQLLDDFKALYTKWSPSLPPVKMTPLSETDTLAAIFNKWVFVNSYTARPVMKASKYFSHSFSFFIYSLIDLNSETQQFLQQSKNKPDLLFLFAYYSTAKTLQLVYQLLVEQQRQDIIKDLYAVHYFLLKDPTHTPSNNVEHNFFKHNKDISQYFTQDYKNKHRYKYCLDHAVKAAKSMAAIKT